MFTKLEQDWTIGVESTEKVNEFTYLRTKTNNTNDTEKKTKFELIKTKNYQMCIRDRVKIG